MDQATLWITIACYVAIFFGVLVFFLSIARYCITYHIFETIQMRLKGNIEEYDRLRRAQMKQDVEAAADTWIRGKHKKKKMPFISLLYRRIEMTGVTRAIPGFSESTFLSTLLVIDLVAFVIGLRFANILVALAVIAGAIFVEWYLIAMVIYRRKIAMESQLLSFANACASASMQYADIIDIFGAVADQQQSPFKEALLECYTEAKKTIDKPAALDHLKRKFDSNQLNFVIDNLEECSRSTGDYHGVSKDIAQTLSIYDESFQKQQATLRNAKMTITAMFFISCGILYSLSKFIGDNAIDLLTSTVGLIVIIIMLAIYFYGMNIKAEMND